MTIYKTTKFSKFTKVLAASAAFTLSAASGASAAGDDDGMVFDDDGYGSNYYECFMDGGIIKETPTTKSCTYGGKPTTCDKQPVDEDAACSTESTARVQGGRFVQTGLTGTVLVAPGGSSAPLGYTPISIRMFNTFGQ